MPPAIALAAPMTLAILSASVHEPVHGVVTRIRTAGNVASCTYGVTAYTLLSLAAGPRCDIPGFKGHAGVMMHRDGAG